MRFKTKIIILFGIFMNVCFGFAKTIDSNEKFFENLNLNDLNGHNGFKLSSKDTGHSYCTIVKGAGDINGDGFADILIGSSATVLNTNGLVYVVFGSNESWSQGMNLSDLNGKNGFAVAIENDFYNGGLSGAGDINGDGIDDFSIGFSKNKNSNNNHGQIYIVFGTKNEWPKTVYLSNLDGKNGFAINGTGATMNCGFPQSNAGDVNHDGVTDILIGASTKSYIVFGSKGPWPSEIYLTNLNGSNGFMINYKLPKFGDPQNRDVSGAGDINGDGIDDIIIGGPIRAVDTIEESYVIFGSKEPWSAGINVADLNGRNGFTMKKITDNDIGDMVSGAGDFNNDGIDDILITGHQNSYVVFGSNNSWPAIINISDLNGKDGFIIRIKAYFVDGSGVMDVNGDNITDILLSTYSAIQNCIIFGSNKSWPKAINLTDINGINGFVIDGLGASEQSGCSVSGVGDVNGDGIDDFLIGANGVQGYVVFGAYERLSPSYLIPLLGVLFGGISSAAIGVGGYYVYEYCRHNHYTVIPGGPAPTIPMTDILGHGPNAH